MRRKVVQTKAEGVYAVFNFLVIDQPKGSVKVGYLAHGKAGTVDVGLAVPETTFGELRSMFESIPADIFGIELQFREVVI